MLFSVLLRSIICYAKNLCGYGAETGADPGLSDCLSTILCVEQTCLQACVQTQHFAKRTRGIYYKDKGVDLFPVAFERRSVNRTVVGLFKWLHMYNLIRHT